MKNRKAVLRRAVTGLAALCLVAVLLFGTASPAFPVVTGRMILKIENTDILRFLQNGDKITISLYKLADRSGDYLDPLWRVAETSAFADYQQKLTDYEKIVRDNGYPDDRTLITTIENIIADKSKNVQAVASGDFSRDGTLTFSGLGEGLYFFMMTAGPSRVSIKSAIVPVPFVYKGPESKHYAMFYDPMNLSIKGEVSPTPPTPPPSVTPTPRPTPTPYIPPYIPPVNPNPPINPPVNPPQQNQNEIIIDDYDTPLGIAVEFNHVGDCYE